MGATGDLGEGELPDGGHGAEGLADPVGPQRPVRPRQLGRGGPIPPPEPFPFGRDLTLREGEPPPSIFNHPPPGFCDLLWCFGRGQTVRKWGGHRPFAKDLYKRGLRRWFS